MAALLRTPLLGGLGRSCFLGLGKEIDLLGDDLAALVLGACGLGPALAFAVIDLPGRFANLCCCKPDGIDYSGWGRLEFSWVGLKGE
jgi:hypothetical protein